MNLSRHFGLTGRIAASAGRGGFGSRVKVGTGVARWLTFLIVLIASLAPGRAAWADTILPLSTLMEDQAVNHLFFFSASHPAGFGNESLTYDYSITPGGDFSYSSVAGSMFQGQAFSLTSSGVFDSMSRGYTLSSHGSWGAQSWSVLGVETTEDLTGGDFRQTFDYQYYDQASVMTQEGHVVNLFSATDLFSIDRGELRFLGTTIDFSSLCFLGYPIFISISPDPGSTVPPTMTTGSATQFVASSLPEPASWALLGIGGAAVVIRTRHRRGVRAREDSSGFSGDR